ncbi:MAG: phosphate ABC transporter permease subunit PstC, partial [Candidatus Caldatribacterium sp.]|nr:phosphate ABC transporter permease subunit PstC [Candidatus Caldatribacterium sp.]
LGDVPAGTLEYQTIFAVGLLLFLFTLLLNSLARKLRQRFQEVYR